MEQNEETGSGASEARMTKALRQLLAGPRVFGGPPESIVAPFLERLLSTQVLSDDARHVLQVLSLAGIPLSKSALEVICHKGLGCYEELRRASLVVASRARAQLLPMVATAVMRTLTEEQVKEAELLLIEAYTVWFGGGMVYEREAGGIVTELATLLLKYYRLLEAAELLLRYGWLSFKLGNALTDRTPLRSEFCNNSTGQSNLRRGAEGNCCTISSPPILGTNLMFINASKTILLLMKQPSQARLHSDHTLRSPLPIISWAMQWTISTLRRHKKHWTNASSASRRYAPPIWICVPRCSKSKP